MVLDTEQSPTRFDMFCANSRLLPAGCPAGVHVLPAQILFTRCIRRRNLFSVWCPAGCLHSGTSIHRCALGTNHGFTTLWEEMGAHNRLDGTRSELHGSGILDQLHQCCYLEMFGRCYQCYGWRCSDGVGREHREEIPFQDVPAATTGLEHCQHFWPHLRRTVFRPGATLPKLVWGQLDFRWLRRRRLVEEVSVCSTQSDVCGCHVW